MVYFNYKEEIAQGSISDSSSVDKSLCLSITRGNCCSYILHPIEGHEKVTIENWDFHAEQDIISIGNYGIESDDGFAIYAKENGLNRVINIRKKNCCFEDEQEVWASIECAIKTIINNEVWNTNTFVLDENRNIYMFIEGMDIESIV